MGGPFASNKFAGADDDSKSKTQTKDEATTAITRRKDCNLHDTEMMLVLLNLRHASQHVGLLDKAPSRFSKVL